MKYVNNTPVIALAIVLALSACSKMDDIEPQGGTMTAAQVQETTSVAPERADALFSGMYTSLGAPLTAGFSSSRPDDFGFVMIAISGDLEAADMSLPNSGYNWFSICGDLTSRNADYANPYVRYKAPYDEISRAHDVMAAYGEITEETSADIKYKVAQAYAIRAFCYLNLAPYFQFSYATSADKPCVPIVTRETEDYANNPRATVKEVYDLIISDLTYAIENLEGYERPDKAKIDQQVAYGLRARAYLYMAEYAKAAEDAAKAMEGYTPASQAEISVPAFMDVNEHNWIWGYDMTVATAQTFRYATSSSWIRPFSAWSYSAGTGCYATINNLLYDQIPDTDIRKNWFLDDNLNSPLLDGLTWDSLSGQQIATEEISDVKMAYLPQTAVKFGCDPIGTTNNAEDWPFLRVEEMILTRAEGLIMSGNEAEGVKVLEDFVKTYRDPSYVAAQRNGSWQNEIWFQRRVELWGEGLANPDTRRLNKPLVRFHEGADSNVPTAFQINLAADDGWWLMRFCTSETNTNYGIVDNTGGSTPVSGQNGSLRDGVTD